MSCPPGDDGPAELSPRQMVEDHSLLAGIHDLAADKGLVFFNEFLNVREPLHGVYQRFVHGGGGVAERKALGHLRRVRRHAFRRERPGDVDLGQARQSRVTIAIVEVPVLDHIPLHLYPYDT